jgi:hypothetical protein
MHHRSYKALFPKTGGTKQGNGLQWSMALPYNYICSKLNRSGKKPPPE